MDKAREICNKFLINLDEFLRDNLDYLTCSDINDIYSNFYTDLKDFKGNSNGFTGLSEYTIFRFIYHLLGGSFEKKQITPMLYEFTSPEYRIGQNTPISTDSFKYYPDIVIYRNNEPILAVEIKLYLTSGIKTLMGDIEKLNKINLKYPSAKGLFISYNKISEQGKVFQKLIEEVNVNKHLHYLILNENKAILKDELLKILNSNASGIY